jgi:hypothetical protein
MRKVSSDGNGNHVGGPTSSSPPAQSPPPKQQAPVNQTAVLDAFSAFDQLPPGN